MHTIQIILFLIIAGIVARTAARWKAGEMNVWVFISWILFWSAAVAVVWRPELSSEAARIFGVGRGADLIVYLALIALFYTLFRIQIRLERQERSISKIVETLALREGEKQDHGTVAKV